MFNLLPLLVVFIGNAQKNIFRFSRFFDICVCLREWHTMDFERIYAH